jgi:2-polyprenyl-3-methyl-5-hydroxy-6-metoxy-1,4-benzoquinol methylase
MTGLFRDEQGGVRAHLTDAEGPTFRENPLDFLILLARYKFAARLVDSTDRVLDAGSGHGLGSVFLRPFCTSVVGADADEALIEHARNEYGDLDRLSFEVADLRAPRTDEPFDAIVCMDVIEHLSVPDGRKMLESFHGAMQPGGLLVIGTPNARSAEFASKRRTATHEHEYGHGEFKAALADVFGRSMMFSMTDESVSTGFGELAWYLMGVCVRL